MQPPRLSQQVPGLAPVQGQQAQSSTGALLQLAIADGVKLDVARDDLARAAHPLVVIPGLFPLDHSLQARRKYRHPLRCLLTRQQSCREGCVLLERDVLLKNNTPGSSLCGTWEAPELLLLSPVKVPVCPLTGVYVRNVLLQTCPVSTALQC